MNTGIKTIPLDTSDAFVALHARRNFILNVIEGGLFMFGMNMVSSYTVLPYFVKQFSNQQWHQGLIPAIANIGWLLPGLFVAPLIAHMWTRKPVTMVITVLERIPWLILGLWLLLGDALDATTTLALFFSLYALFMVSAGANAVPWQDFISRIIPEKSWGTFFGMQSGVGSLLGVAGAAVATQILANKPFTLWGWQLIGAYPFPQNIGVLSLGCFVVMAISYLFLAFSIEPRVEPHPEKQSFWSLLRDMPSLLRNDRAFLIYLVAFAFLSLALMGQSFVTAAALVRFQVSGSTVGTFTVVLLASQALGNFGLGTLADRWGRRRVLIFVALLGMVSLLLPWLATSEAWFYPVFVLGGIALGGMQPANTAMVFSFAPAEKRANYIALANSFNVPVMAGAPLVAGWLAGQYGYNVLFAMLASAGLLSAVLLKWWVASRD